MHSKYFSNSQINKSCHGDFIELLVKVFLSPASSLLSFHKILIVLCHVLFMNVMTWKLMRHSRKNELINVEEKNNIIFFGSNALTILRLSANAGLVVFQFVVFAILGIMDV